MYRLFVSCVFWLLKAAAAFVMIPHYLAVRRALRDLESTRLESGSSIRAATRLLKKPFIMICHTPFSDL